MLKAFFLAMVLYPEAKKRAQEEIEAVIGNERLPTMDDKTNLPYTECLLKEIYRYVFRLANGSLVVTTSFILGYSLLCL